MAYAPHFLFSFGGKLGGGEIWNCGVRCFPVEDSPVTPEPIPQYQMDNLAAKLKTWFSAPTSNHASSASLTWLKLNAIGPDGKYLNKNTTNIADILLCQGGVNAKVGSFLSVATTWLTARTRPPGAFGRIYLPNYGVQYDALDPLTIAPATQDIVANAGKALLNIVTGKGLAPNLPDRRFYVPCVASEVDGSLNIITKVAVGRVYDVQRRRKEEILELPREIAYDWQQS